MKTSLQGHFATLKNQHSQAIQADTNISLDDTTATILLKKILWEVRVHLNACFRAQRIVDGDGEKH